jgi:peptidyl-prolyl cis-trans isomerase C
MASTTEDGVRAYAEFRLAHAMYKRNPAELGAAEQAKVASVARRQLRIESAILESAEARDVLVPAASVEAAVEQLRIRYETEDQFGEALAAFGLDASRLREALGRHLRVESVLERVSSRAAAVSEMDVQLHYHLRSEQFRQPERRRAAHILITINPDFPENTPEQALRRASEIRKRLLKDPKRFSEQALKHSECPTAMNAGILGDFTRGQLFPALEAALFGLAQGALSEPVETELGYHLVRCEAITPEHIATYAEASPAIRRQIEAQRREICQRGWIKGLLQEQAGAAA